MESWGVGGREAETAAFGRIRQQLLVLYLPMYIVAIAWSYVAILMAVTERSFVAGFMTFFFYGLAPLALFLWLMGTPQRRRERARAEAAESVGKIADAGDQADSERDK